MTFMKKTFGPYPLGIWIALIALLLSFLGWLMQAYSLINWEEAVKLGLQNGSFRGDEIEQALATKERGEAIADLIWPLPIAIIALVGLLGRKLYGLIAAMMEFGICVYFPLFYLFQLWDTYISTAIGAVILWGIPSVLGIIGLWINRGYFKETAIVEGGEK